MSRVSLGTYPTPVELLPEPSAARCRLYVKRDDRTSDVYGGNKVRKLEHLLEAARARGKTRLVTMGAAGSHQVVATAIFGARHGFAVEAALVPQPASDHARRNLRLALAHGLVAVPVPAWTLGPVALAALAARDRRSAYVIPLGGSNPTGSLGFVAAARELAAQVRAGELPEPDVVVVATGSGGTVAGLAAGFEGARLRTRVVGVAVSHPAPALAIAARRLAKQTAALAGLDPRAARRAAARVSVDGRWVGRGYGHETREGRAALDAAARAGLALDPTYTAKAFACALARARAGETVLFWNTLSGATHDVTGPELSPRLARLFR